MTKIKVYAMQFDRLNNNAEEIASKLGAILSTERRPFGNVVLHHKEAMPTIVRDGDWITKTDDGYAVVSDSHFQKTFEAMPIVTESVKEVNYQIENNFSYHAPKEGQPKKYEEIRNSAKELAYLFDKLSPDNSREKSLAMTKLEEAVFWINASIARNE